MATILSRFSSRAINTDVEAAPATTSKQAIIYCRVSSQVPSNYGDGCVSLQAQEAACREYCRENKIAVVEVHHEVRSGRNMERMHILNRIVRKLKPGQQIVFYNITRFSRNVVQGLNLITKIQNKGCSVYSVQEKCAYADAASQHLFRSTLCFAQHESDQISQRVRTSVAFRKARGDHFGPAPFGKKVDRLKSGKRVLLDNVAEKRVIEKIKKLYYDKMTPIDIAHYLNGEGVLNRGKDWTSAQISALIQKHCHLRTNDLQRAVKSLELESGVDELLTQASVRSVGKRGAASMQVNEPDAEVDLESDNESESSDLSEDSDSSDDSEEEAPPKKVTAVDRPKRYRR